MSTIVYSHPACAQHDTGAGHPERSERLGAVLDALESPVFQDLVRQEAPRAQIEQIEKIHPRAYIDHVLGAVPASGHARLDADTVLSTASGEAGLRAAGAVVAAVDAVAGSPGQRAFCAVRPPGHHAEPNRPMGFCLFNSVAIAAANARAAHDMGRVAVVDFDVHHGNGTQAAFWNDGDLFYASTHQWPLYPGTGDPDEHGAANNIVNATLAPFSDSEPFRQAVENTVLPALERFKPELLIISAGFDAHRDDPLAQLNLETEDFAWVTRQLCELADRHCGGRVVSALEGGYDLPALADSVSAHVAALMGIEVP